MRLSSVHEPRKSKKSSFPRLGCTRLLCHARLDLEADYLSGELSLTHTPYVFHAANRVYRKVDAIAHQQVLHSRCHISVGSLHGNECLAVELSHVGLVSWKCTQVADLQYSDATY